MRLRYVPLTTKVHRSNLVGLTRFESVSLGGLFDPRVNLAAERREIDWLGQERLGAALQGTQGRRCLLLKAPTRPISR